MDCSSKYCKGSCFSQWNVKNTPTRFLSIESFNLAESFLREFYQELDRFYFFLFGTMFVNVYAFVVSIDQVQFNPSIPKLHTQVIIIF